MWWRRSRLGDYRSAQHRGRWMGRTRGRRATQYACHLGRHMRRCGYGLDCAKLIGLYSHRNLLHGTRAGQRVLRDRDDSSWNRAIGIVNRRNGPSSAVFVIDIYNRRVINNGGVADVDACDVLAAGSIRWNENIARSEWKPTYRASPSPKRSAKIESAALNTNPGNQSGSVNGSYCYRTRQPTPAPFNGCPSPIVEWCETPRLVVYPTPAPRVHPRPMPVVVRRPIRRHVVWRPNLTVPRRRPPRPVLVQIFIPDNVRGDITGCCNPVFALIARLRPIIEVVRAGSGIDVVLRLILAINNGLLARGNRKCSSIAGHLSIAISHRHVCLRRIGVRIDSIVAGSLD